MSETGGEIIADNIKSKLKVIKLIVFVAALLVVAIIALPFVIDVNRFRPEIESRLEDALGRKVKLGNLKLSLLSGSVKIDDIAIADNPAFSSSPFLVSQSFQAGVELMPLILSKEIRITRILLDHPRITLIRSSAGKWNFSDLGNAPGNRRGASNNDSNSFSEPPFSVRQVKIAAGRISYIQEDQEPAIYENVNLIIDDFDPSSSFLFTLAASLPGGGSMKLEGKAGPWHKANAVLMPAEADLELSDLNIVAAGFVPPDAGISGIFHFKGTVISDGRWAQSNGHAKADSIQLVRGGTPSGKPINLEYAVDYDLANQKGTLTSGEIKSGQAIARMNGEFNRRGERLILNMRLSGTDMPMQDLTTLLPAFGVALPRGASLEGGTLEVDLTATGSLEKIVTSGTAEISETRLTGFDLAAKMAALASLTGIQSSNVTDIETLASRMRLTPEGIQVSDILLVMPALGKLSGAGKIDTDQSLDFAMRAELKPAGILGSGLEGLLKRDSLNIPFFVRGTSSDPQFALDTKNAAYGLLRSKLSNQDSTEAQTDKGDAIGEKLKNLLRKKTNNR